jgi:hypothetical protein
MAIKGDRQRATRANAHTHSDQRTYGVDQIVEKVLLKGVRKQASKAYTTGRDERT